MRPAVPSTPEPPEEIASVELREYVAALRRRVEVAQDLAAALVSDVHRLRGENQELQAQVSRLRVDLQWHEAQRTMEPS